MRGLTIKWLGLGLAVLGLLAGCGGGDDTTKAKVRLVNASSGFSALSLIVEGDTRVSSVAYGASNDYVDIDPDDTDAEVRRAGATTALTTFTASWSKKKHYSVLAYGDTELKTVLLDDNQDTPDSGKFRLRVLNAAPDAGAVDVYITGNDDVLTGTSPVQAAAAVGSTNGYVTITSGTRRLRVTAAGSKTDLRLDLATLGLDSGAVGTLVITAGKGGVLVNALLLKEQQGIARHDNDKARVRVAAAVGDTGTVTASAGGTALMTGVGAPAVGLYTLVTAGSLTPAVSVNGSSVSTAATTLAAGADYTLMVYGPASTAVAVWLDDDNRLPSDISKAKVRLVHGIGDLAAAMALSVDFTPVADSVTPGTASAYYDAQSPSTTAVLSVTATGQTAAIYSAVDQVFAAGSNYTLFVVGSMAAKTGILRKDR